MNIAIYLVKPPGNSDAHSSLEDMFTTNKQEKKKSHFTCWLYLVKKKKKNPQGYSISFPTVFSHPRRKCVQCLFHAWQCVMLREMENEAYNMVCKFHLVMKMMSTRSKS